MKVLITGVTGLVGGALAKMLKEKGVEVFGLVRPGQFVPGISCVIGDLMDVYALSDAMQGMDFVVHAAAIVSFSPKDRASMYRVNVEGTANVVNSALTTPGIKKLIFISSIAALGRPAQQDAQSYIQEDHKWEDSPHNSHYAISKFQAECEVWRAHAEGLPVLIFNPTIILGEGNWNRSSAQLFKYVYEERPFLTPGSINYVDVEDVCRAIWLGIQSPISGERFIVNAGQASYQSFFEKVATLFQKKAPSFMIQKNWLSVLWRLEAIRSFITRKAPLITRETATSASLRINYPSKKLQETFLFEFTPLDKTLKRITQYFKTNQKF